MKQDRSPCPCRAPSKEISKLTESRQWLNRVFILLLCSLLSSLISSLMANPPPIPFTQAYVGEPLSLNFQDVELRAVLKIIADFSGFNLIMSDTVKGNITLHLNQVPWDQALDIVLKTKGLDKRQIGNVILIAPVEEVALREKQELDSQRQLEDLGSLRSELIQMNYAKAEDLALLLKDKSNSLMTSRGTATVDKRTNALLLQDTDAKLTEIKRLLKNLDIPVRQVEIATQIVTADNALEEALGVRLGATSLPSLGSAQLGVADTVEHARKAMNLGASSSPHLFTDLGSTTIGGGVAKLGFSLAKLPHHTFIDLELQALEYESKVKTISRPKLITVDQNKASVETGVEIPYQETTASGAASVAFKKAVLRLEVTPHITADNKILLDLIISNDSQGSLTTQNTSSTGTSGAVSINTNKLQTKVLASDGETIVLGGVLSLTGTQNRAKVPFLADLPIVGGLFKNRYQNNRRKELLIFITPKILFLGKTAVSSAFYLESMKKINKTMGLVSNKVVPCREADFC